MTVSHVLVAGTQRLSTDALARMLDTYPELHSLSERPSSGAAVLRLVESRLPAVVLSEYQLEDMQGPSLTRAVLARAPEAVVLHVSGMLSPADIDEALAAGAAGVLPKWLMVADVRAAIQRALAGERPVLEGGLEGLAGRWGRHNGVVPDAARRLTGLTTRQLEVLRLLGSGLDVGQTAGRLRLAPATVRRHIHNVLVALNVQSLAQALAVARRHGVIP